ncbi:MAG: arginine deiminase family protein [Gemmatimonadota bacterium]
MNELGQSDVLPLRSVLLKHARDAFGDQPTLDGTWEELAYLARPDFAGAVAEYEAFLALLEGLGAEIHLAPVDPATGPDSVYVRDATVICDRGAILCNMGKQARETEPGAAERSLRAIDVPIVGRITGSGRMEGGDVAWIDERNVAVGLGYRTNAEGIRQLRALLGSGVDRVVPVPLPHWHGPGDVFHLMSMFSPVDRDLAVVYSPLLPVPFRQFLLKKGYELVEVPDEEFESMGCNVLAVGPRRCVALDGNPVTRGRLEAAGAEVHTYRGREISTKGGGGPTCLTRPLVRSE